MEVSISRKESKRWIIERFEHVAMAMRIEIGKKKIYLSQYPYLCFESGWRNRSMLGQQEEVETYEKV